MDGTVGGQNKRPLLWYDYADRWLDGDLGSVLDYGCGPGEFLSRIADRCRECHGVDVDADKVARARERGVINAQQVAPSALLPFPDGRFDTVIIMEVIEHVADERATLSELARVLRPGGRLLLTTPHRGLLTFLDPGNVKFVVPGVHRFVHCTLLRRRDYYDARFGDARVAEKGMLADFTTDQDAWHRHYAYEQIRALAPPELRTVDWAAYYPAFRALWFLRLGIKVATLGRYARLPWPVSEINNRLSRVRSRAGDQLVVLFEKV